MTKVYILDEGEYSDYHVIGIFSTKKNANKIQKKFGGTINEIELDPGIDNINAGLSLWHVNMERNGDVTRVYESESTYAFLEGGREGYGYDGMYVDVWAKDAQHAIKICNEKRIMKLASGEWPFKN